MSPVPDNGLLRVCSLLNTEGARYLVVGAQACILHGLVRTTEDVDILIEEDEENYWKVIRALSKLEDGAARELTAQDFRDNVVVKVADEVEVDISRRAWKVDYASAVKSATVMKLEGVDIPCAGLESLIASKETYREHDRADNEKLKFLLELKKRGAP